MGAIKNPAEILAIGIVDGWGIVPIDESFRRETPAMMLNVSVEKAQVGAFGVPLAWLVNPILRVILKMTEIPIDDEASLVNRPFGDIQETEVGAGSVSVEVPAQVALGVTV